ncbi:MAG: gamma-glutamyltransferase family protein [Armatimonadetes bacterium]|nr:gamma-glutamyltransferase family protein [Armatimonadota bacterium]
MRTSTGGTGGRPMIMSARGVVSSGHYLATGIGVDILRRGGNAMDAAAAVGFALTLVQPHQCGIAGEVPVLTYSVGEQKVWAISGHGTAPREATLERYLGYGLDLIPGNGFLPALVPSPVATWIQGLRRFGTMRLADVLMPTIELAEQGWPMYSGLHGSIKGNAEKFRAQWPSSAAAFLPDDQVPETGTLWRQPQWAATFRKLIEAESRFPDRDAGLRAAHDAFYRGPIAETIVSFCRSTPVEDASGQAHTGLLAMEDFATYEARIEDPVSVNYRGVDVYKCSAWTQGPVMLQALTLLEGYDLAAMPQEDYIHTVVECMKLAFADREFYYGDPEFARVPFDRLLSKEYAAERRKLVDPERASLELRAGGYPPITAETVREVNALFAAASGGGSDGDTTKLDVIDAAGNMVSATPSGGWLPSSPVIPGMGFPLGTRGQMFSLVAGHPNVIAPGKRPRTTLTPTLATRGGRPFMAWGSPGGDMQDQWGLLFFLNVVDFGMSLQQAVESPTFWTSHFPSSFYPRAAAPGSLSLEGRIPKEVCEKLAARGHVIKVTGDWGGGNTVATSIEESTGVRFAAASPRYADSYAMGW